MFLLYNNIILCKIVCWGDVGRESTQHPTHPLKFTNIIFLTFAYFLGKLLK